MSKIKRASDGPIGHKRNPTQKPKASAGAKLRPATAKSSQGRYRESANQLPKFQNR